MLGAATSFLSSGVASVAESIGEALDKNFTTDEERLKAENAMADIQASVALRELDRQIAEAKHPSVFVAGARPAQIWAATACSLFALIGIPLVNLGVGIAGEIFGLELPQIPLEAMMGAGASSAWAGYQYRERRLEKQAGVARDNLRPQPASAEGKPGVEIWSPPGDSVPVPQRRPERDMSLAERIRSGRL